MTNSLPVFNIVNFEDYNDCMDFDRTFYVRPFKDHLKVNKFIEKAHAHDFYLVLLVTEGHGKHTIDFNEYEVEPGSVFVLSPGQVHTWDLSDDTDGYVLFFTKEYFLIDFNKNRLNSLPFFKSSFSIPYLKLDQPDQSIILNLFTQINDEYKKHQLNYHDMIRLYLNVMFIEFSRLYSVVNEEQYEYRYELVQLNKFESLIDTHFQEHKSLPFYANEMNLSLKQISHLCKKTVGKTPSEILNDRMILEAKRLIIHSDLSISSISDTLNFSDNSYFCRTFKKNAGITPEQFRKEHTNKTIHR